jgi:hypothetical protein
MLRFTLNSDNDAWIQALGRYMLNMGGVELMTRTLIRGINGTESLPIYCDTLSARLGYLRSRFPRDPQDRHKWAMRIFGVADKHTAFRNSVAHSSVVLHGDDSGSQGVIGLLNLTPNDPANMGQIISIEELNGRVNESSALAQDMVAMQVDYGRARVV